MSIQLQTIEAAGFLAFNDPVQVDLRGAPLWAITGENGVGKSTILEAIGFTLFGKVYGLKMPLAEIMNDRAKTMRTSLVLSVEGRTYRLSRTSVRRPSGITSEALVEREQDGAWHPVRGTRSITEMNDWVKRTLRVEEGAFGASVALMQNKQFQFFEASGPELNATLIRLAGIDFYQFLATHMKEHVRSLSDRVQMLQESFGGVAPVEEADLTRVREALRSAESLAEAAQREREEAVRRLAQAGRKRAVQTELAEVRQGLTHARALAAQLGEIETQLRASEAASRQGLPVATWVRGKASLDEAEAALPALEARLAEVEIAAREAAEKCEALGAEVEAAALVQTRISGEASDLEGVTARLSARVQAAETRERLDGTCVRLREEIAASSSAQADFEALDREVRQEATLLKLRGRLDLVGRAVDERNAARAAVTTEVASVERVSERLVAAETELATMREREAEARAAETEAARALEAATSEEARLISQKDALSALEPGTCERCGQDVADHTIEQRKREIAALTEAAREAGERTRARRREAEAARTLLREREGATERINGALPNMRREKEEAERRLADVRAREADRHATAADAWKAARALADEIGLDADPRTPNVMEALAAAISARQERIESIRPRHAEAQRQKNVQDRLTSDLRAAEAELERVAAEDQPAGALRGELERASALLARLRAERTAADATLARLRAEATKEGEKLYAARSERDRLSAQIESLSRRITELRTGIADSREDAIRSGWPEGVVPGEADVERLRAAQAHEGALRRSLRAAEKATREVELLAPRESALTEELETLGGALSPEEAEEEDRRTALAVERAQADLGRAVSARDRTEADAARRLALGADLDAAERALAEARLLLNPLGRKGLQARLLHRALSGMLEEANDVLLRISPTAPMSLELEIDPATDAFDVKVHDAFSPDRLKSFPFISGGMKFRVAVAMALGIGRYLAARSGAHRLDLLVIDEGFGALDESALDSVMDVLDRIAAEVGLVIVVSHNERIPMLIEHRYHVSRPGPYDSTVEMQLGLRMDEWEADEPELAQMLN